MQKVLVLCHGNVNRSAAVAELIYRLAPTRFQVRSGALKESPGTPPAAAKMRRALAERGYSLDAHRARAVTEDDFLWADVVLYMDGGNRKRIEARFQRFLEKCHCLGAWDNPPTTRIPDPGFMAKDSEEFTKVVDQLFRVTYNFINNIKS